MRADRDIVRTDAISDVSSTADTGGRSDLPADGATAVAGDLDFVADGDACLGMLG